MSWRVLLTALLLIAALGTSWMVWRGREVNTPGTVNRVRADYVLRDFEMVALDQQGREAFTLRAPQLARSPAHKTIDIATPLFIIPPRTGTGAPWEIRSHTGWVSAKGEELRLRGQVLASSTNHRQQPIRIATEELNVFPDAKRATSAVAVTVTQPGFILNGRGLEAMLDAKRVILKNDVKARYEFNR